ncbi:MFS transporter [Mycobacterium attenuatum]|uniref:MFS transporter n=1 Tax=Mycobacterium attenuatum TaxID=2341086 RepID=UPI000F01F052|nr:MFS transporter [Mycobacterium attenuatum]VBA53066.1 putative NTE family protein [Mycobacterium attenuatum]
MSATSSSGVDRSGARHRTVAGDKGVRPYLPVKQRQGYAPLTSRRQPSAPAVLLVASFGAFLAFLDSTIVNIAFPDIQRSFPTYDLGSLSWILNGYNIVFAAFLVAAGRLADLLGRKRTFEFGVVVFTIASVLCAVAGSVEQLVAFRLLQGIGAAVLVPASLALVVEGFPPERRAHGVGLWGAAAAIASGLGPPIGGMLVEASSWRLVFLVNLPLGIVAVIVAGRVLTESRASGRRRVPDLRGALLLGVAIGALTLGLVKCPDWGWVSAGTLGTFVASAIALGGFALSSRSHPAPLVEPAFLRSRPFVAGNLLTLVAAAGFYCYVLTHVLYLNYVWHYSLLKAGFAIAPAAIVAAAVAAVLGRIADRHGHRVIVAAGALIWAGSLVWYLQRVGVKPDFLRDWLPGQLLQGVGVGATLPVLGSAAIARLPKRGSYATASAVVSTTRQLGAVIGVAVLVILIGKPEHGAAAEAIRRGWAMPVFCFLAVAIAAVSLGSTRSDVEEPEAEPAREPEPAPPPERASQPLAIPVEQLTSDDGNLLGQLPLFAGLDPATLDELGQRLEEVELEAGSYLFRKGDESDSLYVLRQGRLQVLQESVVIRELGRGEVLGELGLLIDAPRSASVRALRDSKLVRLTRAQFDQIADREVFAALVCTLASRLRAMPPPLAASQACPEVVIAVVGVCAAAPVQAVAAGLLTALSAWVKAVNPGRIDRDGLERAEQGANKVVLHASLADPDWRDFCLRVADRIVLVADDPNPQVAPLPARAAGADLVLAGSTASREQRRQWEELITPRSVHVVRYRTLQDDVRPLAARIAGRSIGLALGGGGARALAHLGVLEELERAGITVDRFAGTSMGAAIAALAAGGMDAAGVDAHVYEYFIRRNPLHDYALPSKGLIRGRRLLSLLREATGGLLVEELPKELRCVSVDLLSRQAFVHRRGPVADVMACSMRLPGIFPPLVYDGRLHVDGGVLNNVPVSCLSATEGPLIAVSVRLGGGAPDSSARAGAPRVPGIGDTLLRTMTIGSQQGANAALKLAQVVIRPDASAVGFLESHQIDVAREAGRDAARQALPQIMALLNR